MLILCLCVSIKSISDELKGSEIKASIRMTSVTNGLETAGGETNLARRFQPALAPSTEPCFWDGVILNASLLNHERLRATAAAPNFKQN